MSRAVGEQTLPGGAGNPERLSRMLLALHRAGRAAPAEEAERRALACLDTLVPFDSALWAAGAMRHEGPVLHNVHLEGQPSEMLESYEAVKAEDPLARAITERPGVTVNSAALTGWPLATMAHRRRYGMAHVLSTALVGPTTGLYTAVSLYRADPKQPFAEAERELVQAAMPHLVDVRDVCRAQRLAAAHTDGCDGSAALADAHGVLHQALTGFAERLAAEWPRWRGPVLPEPLLPALREAGNDPAGYTGRQVAVAVEPMGDLRVVRVRACQPRDRLTRRERQVADRLAAGDTHRDVAAALGIAPATARNHISAIYEKLGVHSRAALVQRLGT